MIPQRKTVGSTLDNPDERIAMGRFHLNPAEKAKPNRAQYDLPRQAGIIHPDESHQVFRDDWRRFQRINRDRAVTASSSKGLLIELPNGRGRPDGRYWFLRRSFAGVS